MKARYVVRIRRKGGALLAALGLGAVLLTGCGEDPPREPVVSPTIEVGREGELTLYQVEPFNQNYYRMEELTQAYQAEVASFNLEHRELRGESGQEPMSLGEVAMSSDGSGNVVAAITFCSGEAYETYMSQYGMSRELFFGTVAEAQAAGYELEGALVDAGNGTPVTGEALAKNQKRNILIFEDTVTVRCPGRILYRSPNVALTESGDADGSQDAGLKYIIIK